MALKRVNINLSEDVVSKIDEYARKCGLSRSAAISVLTSTQLQQQEALTTMQGVLKYAENEAVTSK
jgi:metal-responsive CopG/Arc/MetJ family transcriptional regulator